MSGDTVATLHSKRSGPCSGSTYQSTKGYDIPNLWVIREIQGVQAAKSCACCQSASRKARSFPCTLSNNVHQLEKVSQCWIWKVMWRGWNGGSKAVDGGRSGIVCHILSSFSAASPPLSLHGWCSLYPVLWQQWCSPNLSFLLCSLLTGTDPKIITESGRLLMSGIISLKYCKIYLLLRDSQLSTWYTIHSKDN